MPRATINLGESTGQSMVGGRWKFARGYVPGEPNEGLVAQGDATPRAVSACSLKHVSTTTVRSGLMANAIETGVRSRDSTFHRGFWSPPTLRQVSGTRLLCWLPTVLWERRVAPSLCATPTWHSSGRRELGGGRWSILDGSPRGFAEEGAKLFPSGEKELPKTSPGESSTSPPMRHPSSLGRNRSSMENGRVTYLGNCR